MHKENRLNGSFKTTHAPSVEALFGPLPDRAEPVGLALSHELQLPDRLLRQWQISVGEPAWVSWSLQMVSPLGQACPPILLSPDGCWPHVIQTSAIEAVLSEGVALSWFNRTELAFDGPQGAREGPVHAHLPGVAWSALAIWAWGLMRSVDALRLAGGPAMGQLGLVGHSRGGKAALLAGVLDPRVAAVVSHNSGTGGAASLQVRGTGAEALSQLAERFPHWLAPGAADPHLQDCLVACDAPLHWWASIAPRGLCVLQASDDLWANPEGTRHLVAGLRPHWRQAAHRLEHVSRPGGHPMTEADWRRAARFVREA